MSFSSALRFENYLRLYPTLIFCRLTYSPSLIDWCDVVMPCGGDGTFLLAASRVRDHK